MARSSASVSFALATSMNPIIRAAIFTSLLLVALYEAGAAWFAMASQHAPPINPTFAGVFIFLCFLPSLWALVSPTRRSLAIAAWAMAAPALLAVIQLVSGGGSLCTFAVLSWYAWAGVAGRDAPVPQLASPSVSACGGGQPPAPPNGGRAESLGDAEPLAGRHR